MRNLFMHVPFIHTKGLYKSASFFVLSFIHFEMNYDHLHKGKFLSGSCFFCFLWEKQGFKGILKLNLSIFQKWHKCCKYF